MPGSWLKSFNVRLAVIPAQRRQGLGRALVGHALSQARARGARRVSTGIIAEHTELKEWYAKLGFMEGETKSFPHLPFRVCSMELDINDTVGRALEATPIPAVRRRDRGA